jgi:hypothetical protein
MITNKDIQKLGKVLATKEDLKGLETHINELARDVVRIEGELKKEIGEVKEQVKLIPTRDELPTLFKKSFEFATLKAEHDRMKKIIREKLQGGCIILFARISQGLPLRGLLFLLGLLRLNKRSRGKVTG